ncbi:MAG: iron transporter [Parasporobacterium sp.]|nr:iron transporter [Parasporobacterium sp.]
MKKIIITIAALLMAVLTAVPAFAGNTDENAQANIPADGEYAAYFKTDSSMFHVNEACEGKGTLTVKDGQMIMHVSLPSKSTVNLFPGLAEDAKKDGAVLLTPTIDTVTYSDGYTEDVHGFDIPVPYLDEEFDVALIGTKGKWYDHKVSVELVKGITVGELDLEDGTYDAELEFAGGSGKAYVNDKCTVTVKDGEASAQIIWSSDKYDYMLVDGEKYEPVSTEGGSMFIIPVAAFDIEIQVIGDTTAMSTPHEIEYTLNFRSESLNKVG